VAEARILGDKAKSVPHVPRVASLPFLSLSLSLSLCFQENDNCATSASRIGARSGASDAFTRLRKLRLVLGALPALWSCEGQGAGMSQLRRKAINTALRNIVAVRAFNGRQTVTRIWNPQTSSERE